MEKPTIRAYRSMYSKKKRGLSLSCTICGQYRTLRYDRKVNKRMTLVKNDLWSLWFTYRCKVCNSLFGFIVSKEDYYLWKESIVKVSL